MVERCEVTYTHLISLLNVLLLVLGDNLAYKIIRLHHLIITIALLHDVINVEIININNKISLARFLLEEIIRCIIIVLQILVHVTCSTYLVGVVVGFA